MLKRAMEHFDDTVWNIVLTRILEHCDERAWSIVMTSVMGHFDDIGMEHSDDRAHGGL